MGHQHPGTIYAYSSRAVSTLGETEAVPANSSTRSTIAVGGVYKVQTESGECLAAVQVNATTGSSLSPNICFSGVPATASRSTPTRRRLPGPDSARDCRLSGYSLGMADLPWDCVVLGIPRSVQANKASIQRWKATVRAAAEAAWLADCLPLDHEVQIHVTYYHDGAPLDVDNMLKPIQDALCGIVYEDDKQLTDTHGHLRN